MPPVIEKPFAPPLIVISNERLLQVLPPRTPINDAFKAADTVLMHAVQGITDIILLPGLINLDFADVRTAMSYRGDATMGSGFASGAEAAREAAKMAISSPLLEDVKIAGAKGLLVNITSSPNLSQDDVAEAMEVINHESGPDADVFLGVVLDPNMQDGELRITVIATGFETTRATSRVAAEVSPPKLEVPRRLELTEAPAPREQNLSIPTWQRKHEEKRQAEQGQELPVTVREAERRFVSYAPSADDLRVPTFIRKARRTQ